MLRLLHLADVHLGARHLDLGDAGAALRERQWQAFERALDLAIEERCAIVLVAGDLFDSNAQPRRSVERAAAGFARLTAAGIHAIVLPGDADPYDAASVYRTHDLGAIGGVAAGMEPVHVLSPGRMSIVLPALDVAVRGYAAEEAASLDDMLAAPGDEDETGVRLRVGVAHGQVGAGGTISERAIAASGLAYLALGGALEFREGTAGGTRWADPGPAELLPDGAPVAGRALIATLDPSRPGPAEIRAHEVGRTRRLRLELPAGDFADEPALVAHLSALADPDLACEVHLTGTRPPGLRVDEGLLEERLGGGFFHLRIRDASVPGVPTGPVPAAESIPGAFARDVAARLAAAERDGRDADAAELREELDLGLELLSASTGMPV